jgi:Flp pilus assembly protein protease CpaA
LRAAFRRVVGDRAFSKAAAMTLVIRLAAVGLGLFTQLFLASVLGAISHGLFAVAMAWLKTLTIPATLGIWPGVFARPQP